MYFSMNYINYEKNLVIRRIMPTDRLTTITLDALPPDKYSTIKIPAIIDLFKSQGN